MNEARLERIAVAHLERFGSSVANLRRVLRRRIEKRVAVNNPRRIEGSPQGGGPRDGGERA